MLRIDDMQRQAVDLFQCGIMRLKEGEMIARANGCRVVFENSMQ